MGLMLSGTQSDVDAQGLGFTLNPKQSDVPASTPSSWWSCRRGLLSAKVLRLIAVTSLTDYLKLGRGRPSV